MCSVVGCGSWRRSTPRFNLPADPERRLEWVQFLATVNKQRFKESSWTDITICSEHFKEDCFETPNDLGLTGKIQLKPSAVPSVCLQQEADDPAPGLERATCDEPVENEDVTFQQDQLKSSTNGRPSPKEALSSADTYVLKSSPYSQMKPNNVNIDLSKEKATLLKTKGKYVVNEKRLLQLFSSQCPLCGSKLQMEKLTYGLLLIVNQQCHQCEYRNQWKSQANADVPTGEERLRTEAMEMESEGAATGVSEIVTVIDEDSDGVDETEHTTDQDDAESDEEWQPLKDSLSVRLLHAEPDGETEDEGDEEYEKYPSHTPRYTKYSQLCTECGMFYGRRWPHTCEHKIKPYSCNICGKRCVSEIALNTHSRIHDENYEHRCKYCHAPFKTKVDKIAHEQIHVTEGKPYKCPDCSETFATNKERKIHLEDHRGPKQLTCHICGIEFLWPLSLQRHLAVHTGEKPFKCSECQRGFNQAGHLKSHMRLHTGERPYKCQHCDKQFNHNVSLKSHLQRYHSARSGCERKTEKMSERASDSGDMQEDGSRRGADSDIADEDQDTDDEEEEEEEEEEEVEEERMSSPKKKRRSTGRPIGRPKNLYMGTQVEDPGPNGKNEKLQMRKLKRKQCSNEESEDEPSDSHVASDSAQEEGNPSEKVTRRALKPRARQNSWDSDSEFDPGEAKKTKHSNGSSGRSTGRRRGRPRKHLA